MAETFTLRIPWGSFTFPNGAWLPNRLLSMSEDEQQVSNLKNGISCEHRRLKASCVICGERK